MAPMSGFPKVALRSPPSAGPVCSATCLVLRTISDASGTITSAATTKSSGAGAPTRFRTTATGNNTSSHSTEGRSDMRSDLRRRGARLRGDGFELGQVADLVRRRRDACRQRVARRVYPGHVHPHGLSPNHVDVGAVANEKGASGLGAGAAQRSVEDIRVRLAPTHLVRDHDRGEQLSHAAGL